MIKTMKKKVAKKKVSKSVLKRKAIQNKKDVFSKAKTYIGIEFLLATLMTLGAYNRFRGWVLPSNEDAKTKGYIVKYPDSYISWCPQVQFEDANMSTSNLDFSAALFLLKQGEKLARKGWDGKKMFIYEVPENTYPAKGNKNGTLKGLFPKDMVPYGNYLAMKTAQNNVVPWLCSQTDMFATDWCVVK